MALFSCSRQEVEQFLVSLIVSFSRYIYMLIGTTWKIFPLQNNILGDVSRKSQTKWFSRVFLWSKALGLT